MPATPRAESGLFPNTDPLSRATAHPFLKWVGGKRQLLNELLARTPKHIDTYYEPFLGGGALFFALAASRRFQRAVLSDINADLIATYRALQDDLENVITELKWHASTHCEGHYYQTRSENQWPSRGAFAARFIYLNRTCFNGLYRVNSRGLFNVPIGRYTNPTILDEENLRAVSDVLVNTYIEVDTFDRFVSSAGPDDFVYLDPPYVPISPTSSFTKYDAKGFGDLDQERLATSLRELGNRRIPALLSNSDCPRTRQLYRGMLVDEVLATRRVNCNSESRGKVDELLIRSFDYDL